ncbi:protein artemis-like [Armigeres subalbatus]|uniref:protein artemis-like n=1 Tax=Armigeres subalbatus TaxID=124917 RepID=UPI002ED0EB5C
MSTFSGFFSEIPGISADRFEEVNRVQSRVFFLSHCHMDHMQGLNLEDPLPGPLYASPISGVFLKHRFPQITESIRSIEIGDTISISLESTEDNQTPQEVQVTAIPAGHCPGSIMFLFQTKSHKVLYTGDFRLSPKDLRNIIPLRNLTLDVVYLDTTFFLPHYLHFPSQTESLSKLIDLCQEWLSSNPQNVITLKLPALYGSEFLFMELSRRLGHRIHVKQEELRCYRFLASLDNAVTAHHVTETRIHACQGTRSDQYWKLPCRPTLQEKHIRVIRPSALRWRRLKPDDPIHRRLRNDREEYSVCYSNHASYGELEDFLQYLRPRAVRFNVLWKDDPGGIKMSQLLQDVCPWLGSQEECVSQSEESFKFDGIVYQRTDDKNKNKLIYDEDSDEDKAVIEHLPKRIRTMQEKAETD